MGYDNPTKNCKFITLCSESVRCGANENSSLYCYRRDNRTRFQKFIDKNFNYQNYLYSLKNEYNTILNRKRGG